MDSNSIDLFVGERIIHFRKKREITQEELALSLDISRQQLQKYETGITRIPIATLSEICQVIGIKLIELVNGIDDIRTPITTPKGYVTTRRTNPLNILLAEDNSTDALLTQRAIEKSGHDCNLFTLNNGAEVLEYLKNNAKGIITDPFPDIVFLDLNMPRMRGEEVLKYIKTTGNLQHIPVVVITNSISKEEMHKVYKLGASGYVVKSFEPKEYFPAISAVVSYWSMMVLPSM